jgi:hypothetical protein
VQRQALKLATEQAGLRAKYASVFVNLSRRSQGLVQRQLQLLERLERDEEDADQLATLFQLDHLATRMRRNNENLMVLSGTEVGRRTQRPTSLADLLRASVSEIEQYQRVVLLPPPNVQVVGYAVSDLVRLVAELLDNATAFSAPDTQVTIASHSFEDGSLCIAVLDDGIGMSQAELDEANHKLADSGSIDVSTSRRMGLFVIGRLAGRHGIEVRLNVGHDVAGVRATVTVPPDVVVPTGAEPVAPVHDRPANGTSLLAPFSLDGASGANGHRNGHTNGHRNGITPSPLPRRPPADTVRQPERTAADPDPRAGRTALPRRSPGEQKPGPDLATPRAPFEPPAGKSSSADDLFTPDEQTSWWDTPDRAAIEETTPIFDEMASAWFRAVTDHPAENGEPAVPAKPQPPSQDEHQSTGDDAWNFAADSGFDAARAVSNAEPSDFTSGGLPRRSPRQNLIPGSAAPDTTEDMPRHERDADDVRARLSDYRHGVRRARDHRRGEPPSTPTATPVIPPRPATRRTPQNTPTGNQRTDPGGHSTEDTPSAASGQTTRGDGSASGKQAGGGGHSAGSARSAGDSGSAGSEPAAPNGQSAGDGRSVAGGRSAEDGQSPASGHAVGDGQIASRADHSAGSAGSGAASNGQAVRGGFPAGSGQAVSGEAASNGRSARGGHSAGSGRSDGESRSTGNSAGDDHSAGNGQFTTNGRSATGGKSAPNGNAQSGASAPAGRALPSRAARSASGGRANTTHHKPARADRSEAAAQPEPATPVDSTAQSEPPATPATKASDVEAGWSAWIPSVGEEVPGQSTSDVSGSPDPSIAETAQLDLSGAGWRFAADIGWRAANQVSTATPVDFTSGGLPRRSPRQNLVPGSVSHSGNGNGGLPPRMDRAEEMRGRLGSFQKGLSRGRRSLADRAPANGFHDKQQQESE